MSQKIQKSSIVSSSDLVKKEKNILNWLRLSRSRNMGPKTFFHLMNIFGNVENILDNFSEFAKENNIENKFKINSLNIAEKEFEKASEYGAKIITFEDEKYPKFLREIPNPPIILTAKGDLDFLNYHKIAVVGPRNASLNALKFAAKISVELGQKSIITASGMARGVDSSCHEASILSGTLAVLAGGINHVYPVSNSSLYQRVIEHGLIISENAFSATPMPGNFIQRNRIISGISLGVVVVEASLKSGSLTTAKFALEQGREVFAVPGSPFDDRSRGSNKLIKDGAKMIEDIDDIIEEIPSLKGRFFGVGENLSYGNLNFGSQGFLGDNFTNVKKNENSKTSENLGGLKKEIMEKLSYDSIKIDDLIEALKVDIKEINVALAELELLDKIIINFDQISLKA
jgi:DNA processing protein